MEITRANGSEKEDHFKRLSSTRKDMIADSVARK